MMQRCLLNALRKQGFSRTVSALALIGLILLSGFAHEGTSPQVRFANSLLSGLSRTTVHLEDGVTL